MWIMATRALHADSVQSLAIVRLLRRFGIMASTAEGVLLGHKQTRYGTCVSHMALRAVVVCKWSVLVSGAGRVIQILVTGHTDHGAVKQPHHSLEIRSMRFMACEAESLRKRRMSMRPGGHSGIEIGVTGKAEFFAVLFQNQHVGEAMTVMARLAVFLLHRLMLELRIEAGFRFLMA